MTASESKSSSLARVDKKSPFPFQILAYDNWYYAQHHRHFIVLVCSVYLRIAHLLDCALKRLFFG